MYLVARVCFLVGTRCLEITICIHYVYGGNLGMIKIEYLENRINSKFVTVVECLMLSMKYASGLGISENQRMEQIFFVVVL